MHAYVAFCLTSPFLSYLSSISTNLPPLYQVFDSICMPDLSWCKLSSCAPLLPSKDGCILFKYLLWRPPNKFSLHSPWDLEDLPTSNSFVENIPLDPRFDTPLNVLGCVLISGLDNHSSLLVAEVTQSLGWKPAMRVSIMKGET